MAMQTIDIKTNISQWGNSLAVRLNKTIASVVDVTEGTPVHIHAEQGRIVIETVERRPSLDEMLASFDPVRHGGEAMAFDSIGTEVNR